MPIVRYPRRNERLAPDLLQSVLDVPVPAGRDLDGEFRGLRLVELDETVWSRYPPETCERLGRAIVHRVQQAVYPELHRPANVYLPLPSKAFALETLSIETRTFNALSEYRKRYPLYEPSDWAAVSLWQLLALPAFGAKSLVDFLCAYETLCHSVARADFGVNDQLTQIIAADCSTLREWLKDEAAPVLSVLLDVPIPSPPDGATLATLRLKLRTANAIRRAGYADNLAGLSAMTIRELLDWPNFGITSLRDLLGGLLREQVPVQEAVGQGIGSSNPPPLLIEASTVDEEVVRAVERSMPKSSDKSIRLALRAVGLADRDVPTLREIGAEFGVSHERVRQVLQRARTAIQACQPQTPLLLRAIAVVSSCAPCLVRKADETLADQSLFGHCPSVEYVVRAADLLGIQVPWCLTCVDGIACVFPSDQRALAEDAVTVARESVRMWGVTSIADLASRLSDARGHEVTREQVAAYVSLLADFRWLEQDDGWFWLNNVARNRLLTPIRKILAVAGRIPVVSLRSGIGRVYRLEGFAPPARVLRTLCQQLPGYRVEDDTVIADPSLDWRTELESTERLFAEVLLAHGSVMTRRDLEEKCLAASMNRSTFFAYLTYSPIIERLKDGIYGLRGGVVQPGVVESFVPRSVTVPVRLDFGWTSGGQPWMIYRISGSMLASGVCGIAGGFRDYVQGEFLLQTVDRSPVHTLTVRGTSAWGLKTFFTRRGGEEGDKLRLVFDLKHRTVTAEIGDDDILTPLEEDI
jgi:hypothetical protein